MSSVIVRLPFEGFYESAHDAFIDDAVEAITQDDSGNCIVEEGFTDEIDYGGVFLAYARAYVENFNSHIKSSLGLNLGLTFESLDSPKEYNFTTDRIYAHLPLESLMLILLQTKEDTLRELITETFTSRSGFISFYSSSISKWYETPILEWDYNQIGTVFEAWLSDQDISTNSEDIMEDARSNGVIDEMIYDNLSEAGHTLLNNAKGE